jgi:hypothetical protein
VASRNFRGDPPFELEHIWRWYCELGSARTSNGFGLNPLSYTDIKAYADLTRAHMTPWEIGVLKRLDLVTIKGQKTNPTGDEAEPDVEAAIDDVEGVKGIFASLKARAAQVFGKG